MFLLGTTVVLVGAALYRPKEPGPPDNLLEPGSCVTIEPNGDAREANCTSVPGELVVSALIGMDELCPAGPRAIATGKDVAKPACRRRYRDRP